MTLNDRKPIFQGQAILWRWLSHKGLQIQFLVIWQEAQLMQEDRAMPFLRTTSPIFVSPLNVPSAITLNVAWIEREFDAYKLPRCMCSSNYNRFWDRAIYWWKMVEKRIFFRTPLHSTPLLRGSRWNIGTPFGIEKLEWLSYRTVEKCDDMFIRFDVIHERDRRTDGQTDRQTNIQTYRHHMTA